MLQTLRTRAAGTVAKVLFSVLILSFAVWGIGDYAFLRRGDPTAIDVAGIKVKATELGNEYRRDFNRLRQSLGELDPETARQFGLMDRVIDRIVAQALFSRAAQELGLRIGDDLVRMRVLNDPSLRGPDGSFDRSTYLELLRRAGYTEDRFVSLVRSDIARALITEPLAAGIEVAEVVVDRLYRYRNEKRTGETVFVSSSSFTDVGEPDADALQVIYDDNHERFTAPEYRELTVVRIGADEMVPKIQVDEEDIRAEYEARLADLRVPERREIEQILFRDEAAAKAAYDKIAAGADFIEVARAAANQSPETTKLGLIDRNALLSDLSGPVFALEEGMPSQPIKSPFGWHLFRVTKIEPGREPTFDEIKEQLKVEIARRDASNAAIKASNQLEDALGAGASLEDAAKQIDVPMIKVSEVDLGGLTSVGAPVPIFADASDVLNAAFEAQEGRETSVVEARGGGFYVVRVDRIVASRLKPLEEVRGEVDATWRAQKRDEAAKARAEIILERVKAGQKLEAAAAEFSLKPESTPATRRTIDGPLPPNMTPDLVGQMFRLKPDEYAIAGGRQGYFVVRLAEIAAADPASDAAGLNNLRAELRQRMAVDLSASLTEGLKRRLGVTIDQEVVRTVQ